MKARWEFHPSTRDILGVQRPCLLIDIGSWRNASESTTIAINCMYHLHLSMRYFLTTIGCRWWVPTFVRLVVRSNGWLIRPKLSSNGTCSLRSLRRNEWSVKGFKSILGHPRLRHSRTSWRSNIRSDRRSCMSSWYRSGPPLGTGVEGAVGAVPDWDGPLPPVVAVPFISFDNSTWLPAISFINLVCSVMVSLWDFNSSNISLLTSTT